MKLNMLDDELVTFRSTNKRLALSFWGFENCAVDVELIDKNMKKLYKSCTLAFSFLFNFNWFFST